MEQYAGAPAFIPPPPPMAPSSSQVFPPYSTYKKTTEVPSTTSSSSSSLSSYHMSYSNPNSSAAYFAANPYHQYFAPGFYGGENVTTAIPANVMMSNFFGGLIPRNNNKNNSNSNNNKNNNSKNSNNNNQTKKVTTKNNGNDNTGDDHDTGDHQEKTNNGNDNNNAKSSVAVLPSSYQSFRPPTPPAKREVAMLERPPELRSFCVSLRLIFNADSTIFKPINKVLEELETVHKHKNKESNKKFLHLLLEQNFLRHYARNRSSSTVEEIGLTPLLAAKKYKLQYAKSVLTPSTYDVWEYIRPLLPDDGTKKDKGGVLTNLATTYMLSKERRDSAVKELIDKKFIAAFVIDGVSLIALDHLTEQKAIAASAAAAATAASTEEEFKKKVGEEQLQNILTNAKDNNKQKSTNNKNDKNNMNDDDGAEQQQQQQQQQQQLETAVVVSSSPPLPAKTPKVRTKEVMVSAVPSCRNFTANVRILPESASVSVSTDSAPAMKNAATGTHHVQLCDNTTETFADNGTALLPRSRSIFTDHEQDYYQQLNRNEEELEKETIEFSKLLKRTISKENELRGVNAENRTLEAELAELENQMSELDKNRDSLKNQLETLSDEENALRDFLDENKNKDKNNNNDSDIVEQQVERILKVGGRILVTNHNNQEGVEFTPFENRRMKLVSVECESKDYGGENVERGCKVIRENHHHLSNFDTSQLVSLQALHSLMTTKKNVIQVFPIYPFDESKPKRFTPNLEYSVITKQRQQQQQQQQSEENSSSSKFQVEWYSVSIHAPYPVSVSHQNSNSFDAEHFDSRVFVVREKFFDEEKEQQPVFYLAIDKIEESSMNLIGHLNFEF